MLVYKRQETSLSRTAQLQPKEHFYCSGHGKHLGIGGLRPSGVDAFLNSKLPWTLPMTNLAPAGLQYSAGIYCVWVSHMDNQTVLAVHLQFFQRSFFKSDLQQVK